MKYAFIFLLSIPFGFSCSSQSTTETKPMNLSKDYIQLIRQQCDKPDIVEVDYTEDGYIEVEYMCNNQRYELGIFNNQIIYTETQAIESQIPYDKIYRKLEKKYQGWIIDEISEVSANDTTFLKVEVIKDGIEQNLYFTKDGKWFKIKTMIHNDIAVNTIKDTIIKVSGYNFHSPDSIYDMPDLLNEISGIAIKNNNSVYCIQDEIGAIFEFNFSDNDITDIHRFTDIGDFEDITINNNTAYILRSDGNLFKYNLKNGHIEQQMLMLNSLNVEGIFYKNGYLYLASKDALVNKNPNLRHIYKFKDSGKGSPLLFLEINIDEINAYLNKIPELKGRSFQFNPSAVAIHPITNQTFILSATDRLLVVYNDKKLDYATPLTADIYYKPEGLSFFSNGDLLISSEGDKRGMIKGNIVLIKSNKTGL